MRKLSVLLVGIALMSAPSFGVIESFEYGELATYDAEAALNAAGWETVVGNGAGMNILSSGTSYLGATVNPTDGDNMFNLVQSSYQRDIRKQFATTGQREWEVGYDIFVDTPFASKNTGYNMKVRVGNADSSSFMDVRVLHQVDGFGTDNMALNITGTQDHFYGTGVGQNNMAPLPILQNGWNHIVMKSEIQTIDYNSGAPVSAWDAAGAAEYWETLRVYLNGAMVFESHSDFYGWAADDMTHVTIGTASASANSGALFLDNLNVVVPEPATLALLGLGVLSLRKRRS